MSRFVKMMYSLCIFTMLFSWTNGWLDVLPKKSSYKTATNNAITTPKQHDVELDILEALKLNNAMRGVNEVSGLFSNVSAWRFHSAFDQAQVPSHVVDDVLNRWPRLPTYSGNLSLHFIIRQHKKTIATLVSINSPGKMSPWFRLTSNLKSGPQLILFYHVVENEKLHQKGFDLPHLQNWTQIALSIAGDSVLLYVDCEPPWREKLLGHVNLEFPKDALMYFRQEPGFKKKFLGAVQLAKISSQPIVYRPWACAN